MDNEQLRAEFEAYIMAEYNVNPRRMHDIENVYFYEQETENSSECNVQILWEGYQAAAKSRDELIGKLRETIKNHEESQESHRDNVCKLDVILNGEFAAKNPSLCDIVSQARKLKTDIVSAGKVVREILQCKEAICAYPKIGGKLAELLCTTLFVRGECKALEGAAQGYGE